MTGPSLVELRELIADVTKNVPLPWSAKDGDGDYDEAWCPWHELGPLSLPGNTARKAELALLGALNAFPGLLARIEALEAALEKARASLEHAVGSCEAAAEYGGPIAHGSWDFLIEAEKSARAALKGQP